MLRYSLSVAVACLIAGTAQAQTTAPSAPAAPAQKVKKVCRAEVDTGSIISKRKCHTKEEWAAIDAANQKNADKFNNARNNRAGGASNSGF